MDPPGPDCCLDDDGPVESSLRRRRFLSLAIAGAALVLAVAPLPGLRRPLLVAVGSELEGVMGEVEPLFERQHPGIDLRWQVQGAQDMVNRSLEATTERPRVLIPANRDLLADLGESLRSRGASRPFLQPPSPIASTLLVAVAWPERARRLFPDGRFDLARLRQAAQAGRWPAIGGPEAWGSFDLRATDPMRSNSGQLTLALWCRDQPAPDCAAALRRALYRPARSTDILLREFISAGPNDGDVAMVYESSALARQGEAQRQRSGGYVLLAPDPTFETVLAAAVLGGEGVGSEADGQRFVTFLLGEKGQAVLGRGGFRRPDGRGGSSLGSGVKRLPPPPRSELEELLRRWQQAG
jgi:hypothetical protein